jgi:hypothetical protein
MPLSMQIDVLRNNTHKTLTIKHTAMQRLELRRIGFRYSHIYENNLSPVDICTPISPV